MPTILETRLVGLRAAVDVQHLYRASHKGDEGAVFALPNGTHVTEAHLAMLYAASLVSWLRSRGAEVLTNDAARGLLVGEYWTRNREAAAWRAHVYLACHVNAGRGRYARVVTMKTSGATTDALARWIGASIVHADRAISSIQTPALVRGERGAVCIQSFPGPAVILEPFFGDNPAHQHLFQSERLAAIGAAIGTGVAQWWDAGRSQRAVA